MSARVRLMDELSYAVCEDALDDYGYILELGASAGQVKKHDGTGKALAVAYKSTKNPITLVAAANKRVALLRHGQVWVKCGSTHSAIAFGDAVKAIAGGLGDLQTVTDDMTYAERCLRVGTALSALGLNTAGYVLVDLNLAG